MKACPTCRSQYPGGENFCPSDGTRLTTVSQLSHPRDLEDPLIGAVFAERYRLVRRIGAGGMGVVYEASHVALGRPLAVKVLRDTSSAPDDALARFRQEAKSASKIGHDNIIQILDFGTTPGGAAFLVMELLDGTDLAGLLAREHALPLARAVPILLQVCRALGVAHEKGIVHRDLKPENVFLVERGGDPDFVKIVDFGMAKMSELEMPGSPGRKLTKTGMIFGTPEYMSTEQAYGRATDHRSDIYALGIIAYEMLVGRVPFSGESFMAVLSQHMLDPPPAMRDVNPNVSIPPGLEEVVRRCLAKDPNERPQSMEELAAGIAGALESVGLGHLARVRSTEAPFPPGQTSDAAVPLTRPLRDRGAPREAVPSVAPFRDLALAEEDEIPLPRARSRSGGAAAGTIVAIGLALLGLTAGAAAIVIARPTWLGFTPPTPPPVVPVGAFALDAGTLPGIPTPPAGDGGRRADAETPTAVQRPHDPRPLGAAHPVVPAGLEPPPQTTPEPRPIDAGSRERDAGRRQERAQPRPRMTPTASEDDVFDPVEQEAPEVPTVPAMRRPDALRDPW